MKGITIEKKEFIVSVDEVFKEKVKLWRKNNWRISEQSVKNLEMSIKRGKIKNEKEYAENNK